MITRVTTCTVCGRDVGLVGDFAHAGSKRAVLRAARHASTDPAPDGRGRRPICTGSGLHVDSADIRTERGPRRRKLGKAKEAELAAVEAVRSVRAVRGRPV